MVGPGEVDDDLKEETIEECSKYGKVLSCEIVELRPPVPDNKAVRILLHFVLPASAIKGKEGGDREGALFFSHY